MPKVVISEFMDEAAIAAELAGLDVVYDPGLVDRPEDLAAAAARADALIVRNRTQVRGALLDAARDLTVVGRLGVGLDNIDLPACRARGIAVYPATGANDGAVAEYVIASVTPPARSPTAQRTSVVPAAQPFEPSPRAVVTSGLGGTVTFVRPAGTQSTTYASWSVGRAFGAGAAAGFVAVSV